MVAGSDPPEPAGGTVHIAVVGASRPSDAQTVAAELVGAGLARAGAIVITGGGPGVMAAASKGAATAGGTVVGILPGTDRAGANPWVGIALVTGLGELRNGLIVRSADALLAVGGAYGTLSEVALALATGVPVVGYDTWDIPGIEVADSPEQAVAMALERAARGPI
ncbi:MAG: hypothetical protein QOF83_3654 [Solirubrobacteraceae bacterium]|jgi:uncharacterized protein (TIGR00725 family)|nr:hypothetical protein [Solirubrobacteraceae bacterium]